jgi:type IX secretion system PorP/SprF family membrane protein
LIQGQVAFFEKIEKTKKSIMKKIIFGLILTTISMIAFGQQDAEYNMYMFNGLYINPAYAGSHDVLSTVGIYRHQWAGVDGAPRTVNISAHSPLRREQYALGGTISNDRLGLTDIFSANLAFAYRIKLKKDNMLSLGVQGGFSYYNQRNHDAITANDNTLTPNYDPSFSVNKNLWLPNVGAGVYFYGKKYFVGFSVPHLVPFRLDSAFGVSTDSKVAHQYNHFILTAGYVFGKEASIVKVRPSFLMKYQRGVRYDVPDFDINVGFLFIDRVWLIGGIRTGGDPYSVLGTKGSITETSPNKFNLEGAIGMLQVKATQQLSFGYAYHYSFTALRSYETGTHEFMVGYDFWYDKKRFVTPRFVKYF